MKDFSEDEVKDMVENIDKFDDIDGIPKEPVADVPEGVEPSMDGLSFKTMDDLLKYKMKYSTAMGKEVEEDLATVLKRAGSGYHYAQLKNDINQQQQQYETEYKPQISEAQRLKEKYSKFEDYAEQNPEWYEHLSSSWENRHTFNQAPGEDPQVTNMQAMFKEMLEEKFSPVNEFMQSQKMQQQHAANDKEFDSQFQTVQKTREQFPQIDFDRSDPETGKTVEFEVLEYMSKSGIKDFNAAFKALKHDEILKSEKENFRLSQEKAEVERKKNGIQGERIIPKTVRQQDIQGLNMDQLMELAQKDKEIFGA